jgi:outer membrane lipoprotein SlyB
MKVRSRLITYALAALVLGAINIQAQTRKTSTGQARPTVRTNEPVTYRYPWQHGYRNGYEDGYVKGKSNFNDAGPRNAQSSEAYRRADRGYSERMGSLAEFQDAYQIGFELGYDDGYFGRGYTVAIPPNLGKVVAANVTANAETTNVAPSPAPMPSNRTRTTEPAPAPRQEERRPTTSSRDRILVRDGVEMKVRLQTPISTKTNREGDQFTAVVLDPSEYAEATITGHIAKLNKSGKMTGKTELVLAFDSIELRNGQRGRFAAQVERVYESEQVRTVDEEGNVETGSRTKDTAVRTGGGAALGAIIGGVIGGGKGAAIGAVVGAGAGAGSVIYQGSKDLQLDTGTEMLIRTAAPAQTRD